MWGPKESRVLFLGSCQTGKSTLCALIANKLIADPTLAVVKCDAERDADDLINEIIAQLPLSPPALHPLAFEQHIAAFQKATGRRPCVLIDEFTQLDSPAKFLTKLKRSGGYIIPSIALFGHPTSELINVFATHPSWDVTMLIPPPGADGQPNRADHKLGAPSLPFLRAETIDLLTQWSQDVDLAQFGEVIGDRVHELALGNFRFPFWNRRRDSHVGMTSSIGLALDEGTFRGRPVAEFLRAQCAGDDPRSPADRLRSALADYTSSPDFLSFLLRTHCPASAIMDEVAENGLLPALYRALAPFRPITRAQCQEFEALDRAVATGALIYELGAYRASSPMVRSLVLWQNLPEHVRCLAPSSSSPPPLRELLFGALESCDTDLLRQPESCRKNEKGLRESSFQSALYTSLSEQARRYGCHCIPEALLPDPFVAAGCSRPKRPPGSAPCLKRPDFLIRNEQATHLIEFAVDPRGQRREAYFDRMVNDYRLTSFLTRALLVFFEPEADTPPDLRVTNPAVQQALTTGQLQFVVVRYDKGLTRFWVHDPLNGPSLVAFSGSPLRLVGTRHPRSPDAQSPPRTTATRWPAAISAARLALMARLPQVREALRRPNDQKYWDDIQEVILANCTDLDDLRELTAGRLVRKGIPEMLAERVVTAISAVLPPLATGS
ncbi:hypothetical protein PAPYR_6595 [Paratrimastix pyriformis]|uniref:ORC1/DEAH AAA+ ATPase domain-containing protein n=1 Tax=Paratrimastix pyriformis TaxID=342808 RepID=A0ABQ8UJA0_9EUKA|nr:hypothetical protein PAPYR_6595 [Paratrimastix pyriformis]